MCVRLVVLLALAATAAAPCSCVELTVCEILARPVIFTGEVIAGGVNGLRENPWYSKSTSVRFKVIEAFRGLKRGTTTVDMETFQLGGMCSPNPYYVGRRYLVAPSVEDGQLRDGGCFSARALEDSASDLPLIRDHAAGRLPLQIRGQVAAEGRYGYDFGKPLPRTKVTAVTGNQTFSATTDISGRYVCDCPREIPTS